MHHRWIGWINLFMCISVLLTASALFYFKTSKSKEIFLASPQDKSNSLPKNSFQFSLDKYEKIDQDLDDHLEGHFGWQVEQHLSRHGPRGRQR